MGRDGCLNVNWKALNGASHAKRKLVLRQNDRKLYTCQVEVCLYSDYKSNRGLRKEIYIKHPWFYYFDKQREVKKEEIETDQIPQIEKKTCTSKFASFTIEEGIGFDFVKWLCASCDGDKSQKEAKQTAKRAMKFFMEALGNNENDNDLTTAYMDCCLSSPTTLMKFLQILEAEWKLSSSGSLNYIKAISGVRLSKSARCI